ncbi:MAG: inositol monophosphatase family protein [Pseudomonadota bacterium]
MIVDPEKVAAAIAEIAANEIAPRFGRLEAHDVDTKSGPGDFVTEADRAAEHALCEALSDIYPAAAFVGEESAAAQPESLAALKGEGAFWVVDPLDGTRNFVEGRREFGTIVALIENGETRAGWIYAIPDETFAIASIGDGARWGEERLAPLENPSGALRGYRAVGNLEDKWRSTMLPRLRARFETDPVKCSAYGYIHLARGEKDFALYSRCHPWDHAAGILMLGEIGGRALYLDDGAPYRPVATQGRPMLVAPSEDRFQLMRAALCGEAA